ncbi:MAG: hypothetical protein IPL78_17155 [Chloroflexi bacterium]|nr:hypothetical protein [Chloroflexota bacterium]
MLSSIGHLLAPPIFADEEKMRQTRIVYSLLLISSITVLAIMGQSFQSQSWTTAYAMMGHFYLWGVVWDGSTRKPDRLLHGPYLWLLWSLWRMLPMMGAVFMILA